jgi:hypothetical protein
MAADNNPERRSQRRLAVDAIVWSPEFATLVSSYDCSVVAETIRWFAPDDTFACAGVRNVTNGSMGSQGGHIWRDPNQALAEILAAVEPRDRTLIEPAVLSK